MANEKNVGMFMSQVDKYNKNRILCTIIMLFPTIDICFSYVFKNDGMMTLYFSIAAILVFGGLFSFRPGKLKITRERVILCLCIIFVNIWIFGTQYDSYTRSQCLIFSLGMFMWVICSNERLSLYSITWLKDNRRLMLFLRMIYYLVIIASVIRGDGLNKSHWETTSLSGPYDSSHLLAYELLLWVLVDAIYYMLYKKNIYIILLGLDSVLIVLTAARTVLIPLAIIIMVIIKCLNVKKKVFWILSGLIVTILIWNYTDIFVGFIEKTNRAIKTSSISSGRGMIFKSSLGAFINTSLPRMLFGMGMGELANYNKNTIWMEIHAHNDFIDALVQYGIVGFAIYTYLFIDLIKKNKCFLSGVLIFTLAFFNGFYVNRSAMIGTVLFLAFNNAYKMNEYKFEKR